MTDLAQELIAAEREGELSAGSGIVVYRVSAQRAERSLMRRLRRKSRAAAEEERAEAFFHCE